MAKFYGKIGYAISEETSPGVWTDKITPKYYSGDTIRTSTSRSGVSDSTNDNLNISTQISIIADVFANQNIQRMVYVEYMGSLWKISSISDIQYPRLVLNVGGVYVDAK